MAAYCEVCSMTLNSVEQLSSHQLGKSHQKKSDSINTEAPVDNQDNQDTKKKKKKNKLIDFVKAETVETPEALGFDINPEQDKQQPEQARGSKRKSDPGFCVICNKYLNSESQSEAHFSSAKHMKKAKLSTVNNDDTDGDDSMAVDQNHQSTPKPPVIATDIKPTVIVTDIKPTVILTNESPAAILTDKSPTAILTDESPTAILTDKSPTAILTDKSPTAILTDESPTIDTDIKPLTLTHGFMFCSFCNLSLNSQSQIDAHRSGSKHKKKVAKAKGLQTAITSTT